MKEPFFNKLFPCAAALAVGILGQNTAQAQLGGVPLWTNRFNEPENTVSTAMVVDGSGNVSVAGTSSETNVNPHYTTIKYSNTGMPLWTNRYVDSVRPFGEARAVAIDTSGKVFVAGVAYVPPGAGASEYVTIAYSGDGLALWTNRYWGPAINNYVCPAALAVDGNGDVFVTGSAGTVLYSNAGIPLWTNTSLSGNVAVDQSGQVFFSGVPKLVKYSNAGVPLWTNSQSPGGYIAADGSGNVFLTHGLLFGSPGFETSHAYETIKYSGTGVPLWTNSYSAPPGDIKSPRALAADGSGNVFVTGYSGNSTYPYNDEYATIKYSGAGVPLWTNRYNGPPGGDGASAFAMAVDGNGNAFVTGQTSSSYHYATIGYSGAGVPLWTNIYSGPVNDYTGGANAVAVDGSGNVFVTGSSGGTDGYFHFATIKYSSAIPPSLTIARTTTNTVVVSWSSPSPGFALQQNTNGIATLNWSNLVATPADDGTTKTLIVNPQTGNRYYRLIHP